jgi:hypothetical protein
MAKYRVLEKSFINNAIVEEGAIVDLPDDATVHTNLEPLDKPKGRANTKPVATLVDPTVAGQTGTESQEPLA